MKLVLGYLLSPGFYIIFGFFLAFFHIIQWISLKLGGYNAHKKSVDALNFCLTYSTLFLFNPPRLINKYTLPLNRPIIFVSNHQSSFDIPGLIYFLRKHHGKFISKIELVKARIPSISINLKYGGGANIDRKDSEQSKQEIGKLAQNMKTKNWSAFIFPEGTRTKDGKMKDFQVGGMATLISQVPDVLIIPVAINGSYSMTRKGMFPLLPFNKMTWEVLRPIETAGKDIVALVKEAENAIRQKVKEY